MRDSEPAPGAPEPPPGAPEIKENRGKLRKTKENLRKQVLIKVFTVELQTPSFGDPKGHYWTPFWQSLVWIGDHLRGLKEVIRCCSWGAVGSF